MSPLITAEQRVLLEANGAEFDRNQAFDPKPVIKLITPKIGASWLIAAIEPDNPEVAFGLCDLGVGCPELGSVSLAEIIETCGSYGLALERDTRFRATKSLSDYALDARRAGTIVTE